MTSNHNSRDSVPIPPEMISRWQRRADLLARVVNVPACLIRQINSEQQDSVNFTVLIASSNAQNPYQQGECFDRLTGCLCEAVVNSGTSVVINNLGSHSNWTRSPDVEKGMMSYMGYPVRRSDGRLFGVLCVMDRRENSFGNAARDLLAEFAAILESDLQKLTVSYVDESDDSRMWRAIKSATLESILVLDTEGNFLEANDIGAKRFGFSSAELIGKNMYQIIPPDVADARKRKMSEVINSKVPLRFEDQRNDRYYDFTIYPVVDASNKVEKLVVFAADVTERRFTREALEKSERKYRELVEEASSIILRWDIEGNVTFFNEYAQKFFGFTEAEILGKNVVGTIVPETEFTGRDLVLLMQEIQRDPAAFKDNENENIKRNGERVWIAWKNRPIFNRKGKLYEIHSVGIDITARKRAEDALRESEALWRSLTESSSDHIITLDENLRIQFVNFASPGLSKADLIGTPIYLFVSEDRQLEIRQLLENALHTGERCRYETEYAGPGGSTIYYESMVAPKIVDGKIVGLTLNARDVTERKRIEKEIEQYRAHLQELVAIRTAELKASNRELESYSYSIAHDLRAPLRAITGFSQILKSDAGDKLGAEDLQVLDRIISAGINMSELIDDILELSRITRSELHLESVNLSRISHEIFSRLKQSHPEREIDWQVQNELVVRGDSRLLEVALQNLIENAWKYTRDRKPAQIELASELYDNEIIYYIRDNGVGFDMQYVNQLFKPFRRLHSPDEFEGTGIGLATVQRIIQRHGGRVWANTQEGKGATFYFTLQGTPLH